MPAKGAPCPNPTCSHTFATDAIRGAAALKCPRCGTLFRFGGGQAPPAKPTPPRATPRPAAGGIDVTLVPPAAQPVPPARPPAARADDDSPLGSFKPGKGRGPMVQRYNLGRGRPLWHYLAIPLFVLLIGGGVVVLIYGMLRDSGKEAEKQADARKQPDGKKQEKDEPLIVDTYNGALVTADGDERVCRLKLPRGWAAEKSLKDGLKALLAYQRKDGAVFVAVAVKDYGARNPRDGELFIEAIQRLSGYFTDGLQMSASPRQADLAGHKGAKVQKLEFLGKVNKASWHGECYLLAQNGIGYCFFIAGTPTLEIAQNELTYLQQEKVGGFQLLPIRANWAEQPAETDRFNHFQTGMEINAPRGVWQIKTQANKVDPNGALYLQGNDPKELDPLLSHHKRARALLLHYAKTTDAKAALREAVAVLHRRFRAEPNGDKLELRPAAPNAGPEALEGVERDIGGKRGRVVELRFDHNGTPVRYALLAVVAEPNNLVVFECDCAWEYYPVWRSEFLDLLAAWRQTK